MHIRVLGPLEVVRGKQVVTPSAPKLRRVLALLAVNAGDGVHIDQIIDELWEDRPPPSAMTTLQTYVYQLRKLLDLPAESGAPGTGGNGAVRVEAPALRTSAGRYVLTLPPNALDFREFERLAEQGRAHLEAAKHTEAVDTLRSALQLWRGPVFSDIGAGPVLQAVAVRLDEVRKCSLERRIDAEMALGRHHELISELSALVAQQPTHEAFQAKLILALYRAGRRSDALQVYQRARAVLASELGLEPSSELKRLHHAVLHADEDLDQSGGVNTRVRVAKTDPPPSDLPPAVSPLVGREKPLAQVRRLLQAPCQSAPRVVMIYGKPGSGKSAFCVHAAHTLRGSYPDGQLFIELVDATGARVDISTALGYCLRAAGIPDQHVPVSLEERTRLLRSWTVNRRVLLVLDDATSAAQLLSLLPTGPGCAALVVCRRRLPGPSIASTIYLEPLLNCDAEAMLTEMLGHRRTAGDPAAVQELVQICEGLQLALRTAATKLLLRPHWPIRRMIERIRPDQHRPHMVSAKELGMHTSVRRTYQLMPPSVRAAFRVVAALQVQPTSASTVGQALRVDVRDAEELLEDLVEFQLAEVKRDGDMLGNTFRYQVAPLLRASAALLEG